MTFLDVVKEALAASRLNNRTRSGWMVAAVAAEQERKARERDEREKLAAEYLRPGAIQLPQQAHQALGQAMLNVAAGWGQTNGPIPPGLGVNLPNQQVNVGQLLGGTPMAGIPNVPRETFPERADLERARWQGLQDGLEMALGAGMKQAAWDSFVAAGVARGLDVKDAAAQADELMKLRAERQGDA